MTLAVVQVHGYLYEKSKTFVLIFLQISKSILIRCCMLPLPAGLLKLMLNIFCIVSIQRRKLHLFDFICKFVYSTWYSTDVFWDWSKDVLTPALFRRSLVANEDNPLLLGPARLRQIRSTMGKFSFTLVNTFLTTSNKLHLHWRIR